MIERDLLGVVPALVVRDADFALGLRYGYESYEEDYEGETFTDVEVMQYIADNLSQGRFDFDQRMSVFAGLPSLSYSNNVGFVVGWLGALMASALFLPCLLLSVLTVERPALCAPCATRLALDGKR